MYSFVRNSVSQFFNSFHIRTVPLPQPSLYARVFSSKCTAGGFIANDISPFSCHELQRLRTTTKVNTQRDDAYHHIWC